MFDNLSNALQKTFKNLRGYGKLSEKNVKDALREVLHDTTAMIVAHRPSTVMLADRVALLEAGKVTAAGAHSDLLRESAHYRHVISSLEDDEARARETEVNL